MRHLPTIALLVSVTACSPSGETSEKPLVPDPAADAAAPVAAPLAIESLLASYLVGRFDSKAQAGRDKSYFGIQLRICRVDAGALGSHVLYVEQARMDTLARPYRQRLYVLAREGGASDQRVKSRVFELNDPDAAIGLCEHAAPPRFTPANVVERPGCGVSLVWDGAMFAGKTTAKDCVSTLEGASYATSEVTIADARFVSWDRGFSSDGTQVWGAVKGPYEFDRRTVREEAE